MTEIHQGIHPDILRAVGYSFKGQVTQKLADAFVKDAKKNGTTFQKLADMLGISVDKVIRYMRNPEGLRHMACICHAMGFEIELKIVDASIRQEITEEDYAEVMSDLNAALDVLIKRINGEADLTSAAEWIKTNFPEKASEIK